LGASLIGLVVAGLELVTLFFKNRKKKQIKQEKQFSTINTKNLVIAEIHELYQILNDLKQFGQRSEILEQRLSKLESYYFFKVERK
jgi:hypothetical protein